MLVIPRLELPRNSAARDRSPRAPAPADTISAARGWVAEGYSRLQIVDRDAPARTGSNSSLIESLARDVGVEVDFAAGADSADQIEPWIDAGASRVVLGPRALAEDDWLRSTVDAFPNTLIVETNVRERRVTTRGWVRTLSIDLLDLVEDLHGLPIAGLAVAAPAGSALELGLLEEVAEACSFPVLVESANPTMNTLHAFEHRGLAAVVVPAAALASALDPRAVANEFGR